MYSTHSGQRRGLLRPHSVSHGGPVLRNLPLFGFLAGLVIFFYVFYVYQAQNAELVLTREKYDMQQNIARKLQSENVDLKVQIEQYKETETKLKNDKLGVETKYSDCEAKLRDENSRSNNQRDSLAKLETEKEECSANLGSLKSELSRLNDTLSAMRTVGVNNEAVIISLNDTIQKLREELERAKSSAKSEAMKSPEKNVDQQLGGNAGKDELGPQLNIAEPINKVPQEIASKANVSPKPAEENLQQRNEEQSVIGKATALPQQVSAVPAREEPNLNNIPVLDRPEHPGDRVKMEQKNMNEEPEEGKLIVPGGEYKNSEEEGVIARPNDEAAPDFENDEKRVKDPDV